MQNKPLNETWNGIETIIVYGMGLVASRFIDKMMQDFQIPFMIDYKKRGTKYRNIPIVAYEEAREELIQKRQK